VFLTPADIQRLTGKKRATAQIRWLRENGWKFTVDGGGWPVVAIAEQTRQMVGGAPQKTRTIHWEKLNDGSQEAA
jgi:hypothetical protein